MRHHNHTASTRLPRDPLAVLEVGAFVREHWLPILLALCESDRLQLARAFADALGLDLDRLEADCRAELARRHPEGQ